MTSSTVSNMPHASALTGAELMYGVQGGVSSNIAVSQVGSYTFGQTSGDATIAPTGVVTVNKNNFTTLSASGTVSGAGFSNYLASPPAIGGTVPAAVTSSAVTVNTAASSLGAGIVINQTLAGTQNNYFANSINVSSDTVNAGTGGPANGVLLIGHDFGGSALQGGRQTFAVQSVLTAPSNGGNPLRQYVGMSGLFLGNSADGGTSTATLANTGGAAYGANYIIELAAAGKYWSAVTGCEYDLQMAVGSSAWYASCVSFVTTALHAVQGAYYDCMAAFSAQAGSVLSSFGILFGPMNGVFPISSTGSIIAVTNKDRSGAGTDACACANGVDFSLATLSGYLIKGASSAGITGGGQVVTPALTIAQLLALSSPVAGTIAYVSDTVSLNALAFNATIAAGGANTIKTLALYTGAGWVMR